MISFGRTRYQKTWSRNNLGCYFASYCFSTRNKMSQLCQVIQNLFVVKVSCLAWRTWSQARPLGTYKSPSQCNKPFQSLNLSWSLKIFQTWFWFQLTFDANNKRIIFQSSQIQQKRVLSLIITSSVWNQRCLSLKMTSHCYS